MPKRTVWEWKVYSTCVRDFSPWVVDPGDWAEHHRSRSYVIEALFCLTINKGLRSGQDCRSRSSLLPQWTPLPKVSIPSPYGATSWVPSRSFKPVWIWHSDHTQTSWTGSLQKDQSKARAAQSFWSRSWGRNSSVLIFLLVSMPEKWRKAGISVVLSLDHLKIQSLLSLLV